MSDNNDDTLLEGDLGDDVEYDVEDEDALLADDYDVQGSSHRTVFLEGQEVLGSQDGYRREPEEPFDDVLDLGVTEGDDLDSELQESQEPEKLRHMKDPNLLHHTEHQKHDLKDVSLETRCVAVEGLAVNQDVTGVESEEEEDDTEESRGDRFKTERTTMVSLKAPNKSYGNIPDSLDHVCVDDTKQVVRRDGAWRGGRRGRGILVGRGAIGGPRPHFAAAAGNINIHPQQQQQGFGGPHFGVDSFMRPPGHPGTRGGIHSRSQLSQQQSPHKILINPHFRGAVQPHPEARLIWDTEMPANQTLVTSQPLTPSMQPLEPAYQTTPPGGGGYAAQQFQPPPLPPPPPPPPQHDHHPVAPPTQQGVCYPTEQSYVQEQHNIPHWQDSSKLPQQVGSDLYTQPSPVLNMQHEPVFHHPNHSMREPSTTHGQPVYGGGGMVQYETAPQQGMLRDVLPPQQHYHPMPPPMSPGSHHLPPPVMASVWHCATDSSTDDGLQLMPATHPVPTQFHGQGIYRLPAPAGGPGPLRFCRPSLGPYSHPVGPGYLNQGSRPPQVPLQFPPGMRISVPHQQHMIRSRQPPGAVVHQPNRSPKKRSSFEANVVANAQFKQVRFDATAKRKKRMPDMSNLHEVQMVDMLPSDTNSQLQQPEEEEDEETREYRKKIEQQKLEREKFLQRKEERRKLAALEKQRELQKKDVDVQAGGDGSQFLLDPPQGNAIATIVNRNTVEPHPVVRHVVQQQHPQQKLQQHIQAQNVKNCTVTQHQQFQQQAPIIHGPVGVMRQASGGRGRGAVRGRGVGRGLQGGMNQQQQVLMPAPHQVVVPVPQQEVKVVPRMKVPAPGQRIVRTAQPSSAVNQSPAAPRRLVLTQSAGHQVTPVPRQVIQQASRGRTVVLRGANSGSKLVQQQQQQQQQQPQQQQQQRIVVQQQGVPVRQAGSGRSVVTTKAMPPQQQNMAVEQPVLPKTKTVSIENLAASTTEQQLKSLCRGIGVLENIQMLPKQRRAIVRFTNPTSAATFYKRYQRKIIDLSLITVSLIPQ